MMLLKIILPTFLLLNSALCVAQPTAGNIREAIAGEITAMKIAPTVVAKVQNMAVWHGTDSIKVRLYFPDNAARLHSIIYQVHGGALIAGDLDTHDNICRLLAMQTGAIVLAIDYRRPPEAPYPAGLNDCMTVLTWIQKTALSWNGDVKRLTLVGDSGGGLLISSLAVKNQGAIPIHKMVLINPAVDLRLPGEGLYGLVTNMYLNGQSAHDSIVSPALAGNISFMPPTLVITSEKDMLKPHGETWFNKLKEANIKVALFDVPKEDHLGGLWAAGHPRAMPAIEAAIQFIKKP